MPINGTGKCRLHGGATPSGPAAPQWKHGRFSKAMGRFRESYREAKNDENLLDVRRTLAVLDVAVQRCATRVNELDTPKFRQQALELYRESRDLVNDGDHEGAAKALGKLGQLLGRGVSEDVAFEQLVKTTDTMSKRIEAAWGIKLKGVHVATRTELYMTMSRIIDIVMREAPKDLANTIIQAIRDEAFPRATPREIEAATEPVEDVGS